MTLKELREEVLARGFDDLSDATGEARINRWLNQAYREITDLRPWGFLEATKEGTAPQTIADLGHVLSVSDKTQDIQLWPEDRRSVVANDPDLAETGLPTHWYLEGEETLKVYPANTTSTIVTRYLKEPAELTEDADEPLVPEPYQDLIVDGAVVRALKNRSNYEAAQLVRAEWERGLRQMAHALLTRNYDRPKQVQLTGRFADYL